MSKLSFTDAIWAAAGIIGRTGVDGYTRELKHRAEMSESSYAYTTYSSEVRVCVCVA